MSANHSQEPTPRRFGVGIPDRCNPRIWLRNAIQRVSRWLMRASDAEMEAWLRQAAELDKALTTELLELLEGLAAPEPSEVPSAHPSSESGRTDS